MKVARFSPDGRWVVAGGEDGVIKIWDVTAGKLLHEFQHHTGPVVSLDFHPNEFLMASGSTDGAVTFWDVETFDMVSNALLDASASSGDGKYGGGVRSIAFTPNGQSLLAAYRSSLCVWKWEPTAASLDCVSADWGDVMDMAIVNDQLVACTTREDLVGIWMVNMQKLQVGEPLTPHKLHSKHTGADASISNNSLEFQVNSVRNVIKTSNGISQLNSASLPHTGEDDAPHDSSADEAKPTKYSLPTGISPPSSSSSPSAAPIPSPAPNPTPALAPTSPIPVLTPAPVTQYPVVPVISSKVPPAKPKPQKQTISPALPQQNPPQDKLSFGTENVAFYPTPNLTPKFPPTAGASGDSGPLQDGEVLAQITESNEAMVAALGARYKSLKLIKSHWTANGSGADSKGVLAVLMAVGELEDAAIMADFLRALPQRDDFITLDLCTAMLPYLIELLNHSQKEDYLFLALSMTQKLVKGFGLMIKTTREAPPAKGVDISKEERLEKCQSCYQSLVTIQHLIVPLTRRSGTIGKNAKDLASMLKIYISDF